MKRRYDLSLILPTYNEETHFATSVERVVRAISDSKIHWQIIFVDDRSTDSTPTLISQLVKKHKNWKAVYHRKNLGRGRAVTDGIKASRAKIVGYIDIDLEVSPVYIPGIVRTLLSDEADVVIGRRIYRTNMASIVREILSVGYRMLSEKLVGTGHLDTESGYKFFNRKKILPILAKTRHPHWFWDTEIVVFARKANLRIREEPVLFLRRFDKKSSVRLFSDTLDYLRSLWELWHRLLNHQS
jgi:glycosyltransferase AglD